MSNKVESLVESIDGWIERVTNFEKSQVLTEALHYHIDNGVPLYENIFRCGSEKYFQLFNYARQELNESKINLSSLDKKLLTETDIGLFGEYKGNKIPLDYPMMESEEELTEADYHGKDVELNKPKRGGS